MRGTSGNLSVVLSRDPLRLAVTASGRDKGELTAADVVLVDGRGAAVQGGRPSAEAELHARVAALTGVGAVVHVHTVAAVAMGCRAPGGIVFRDLEMLKGVGQPAHDVDVVLPVIANSQDIRRSWATGWRPRATPDAGGGRRRARAVRVGRGPAAGPAPHGSGRVRCWSWSWRGA